jgi:hypothetical protein
MSEHMVFQPDPSKFRRDLAIGAAIYLVACPVVYWWKAPALPAVWAACALVAGLALLVGLPLYRVAVRGFDTIGVGPEGIVVFRRKDAFRLDWPAISRVYRFREQLIFETVAPVRRHTVHLQSHEHHEGALFDAIKEHTGRSTWRGRRASQDSVAWRSSRRTTGDMATSSDKHRSLLHVE